MLEQRQRRIQELMSILLTLGYRVPHFPLPWWVWHVWHHVDQPPLPSCSNTTQKTLLSHRSRILLPPRAPQPVQCTKKAIKQNQKPNQTEKTKFLSSTTTTTLNPTSSMPDLNESQVCFKNPFALTNPNPDPSGYTGIDGALPSRHRQAAGNT